MCDSCSVFLYDMRLNQLVAKVFNGDVTETDSRPVSDTQHLALLFFSYHKSYKFLVIFADTCYPYVIGMVGLIVL